MTSEKLKITALSMITPSEKLTGTRSLGLVYHKLTEQTTFPSILSMVQPISIGTWAAITSQMTSQTEPILKLLFKYCFADEDTLDL